MNICKLNVMTINTKLHIKLLTDLNFIELYIISLFPILTFFSLSTEDKISISHFQKANSFLFMKTLTLQAIY